MTYDIIIIGSGLGGLECGSILSRQGLSVLVLERQMQPGGCMQSYMRRGNSYDTGLHYVGGLDEGQSLHSTFKYLGLLDLPWQRLDSKAFDRVTIGNETFHFAEGYDNFANTLAERFPNERKALREYVEMLRKSDEEQLLAITNPEKAAAMSDGASSPFSINAYGWLHEKFSDELLINVLSGTSLKMELRKDTLPLFTFAHGNSGFIQSSWRLRNDGNMLVRKLTDTIQNNGGEVICNAEVTELKEENGRLTTAICANGEQYEGKMFISNVHPAVTCSLIKESTMMKGIYKRRIARLENTFGMFTCQLLMKDEAVQYFNHNKFIYDKANVWELSEGNHDGNGILISCRVPEKGSHAKMIDILTPMRWEEVAAWHDTQRGRRGEDYVAFKDRKIDECIAMAERQMPGLREAIAEIHSSTPLTYRDYNLTPEGAAYGIRKDCNAPMMTILTPRTPIPNLLLTGQNLMLHGLHGVTMTALFTCAEVLGREKIKEIVES